MKLNKVMIWRGIQGAGKTTFIERAVRRVHPSFKDDCARGVVDVFSADQFWGESYQYDPKRINEAHADCFYRCTTRLQEHKTSIQRGNIDDHLVVIDNMSILQREISPYILAAQAYGFEYEVVTIWADWDVAAGRQIHGVPEHIVFTKWQQLRDEELPTFWKQRLIWSLSDFTYFVAPGQSRGP